MDEELRFHVQSYTDDLVRSGLSPAEAARRARIEFGSADAHKEEMRVSLGLRLWDELRADIHYGLRMLRKSPSFTIVAVLSLTLGIGVNTTIFTLAKHLLMDRLNVPRPEHLRLFNWVAPKGKTAVHSMWGNWDNSGSQITSTSFSYPVYQRLRAANRELADLFAFKDVGRMNVTVDGNADVVQGEMVSGNYYEQLGVRPQLGRAIEDFDDKPGSAPVVVISDGFWARHFGRAPSVIGKTILLNLTDVTIVGVNAPDFTGAKSVQVSPDVFMPFSLQPIVLPRNGVGSLLTDTHHWWMLIMARSKPGVTDAVATAALDLALKDAVRSTMNPKAEEALPTLRLGDGSRGMNETAAQFAKPIYVLFSLVGFVLLLACANIANLLLARASARQREMSVRLAMGASRRRILRQVLTESVLLSVLGGAGGLLLAFVGSNEIPLLLRNPWEPTLVTTPLDWSIFAFNAALAMLTGVLFGIIPAWQATRTEVNTALKDAASTTTRRRHGYAGKSIVAFQIALSTLLVLGASVFLRTLLKLDSVNTGIDSHNLVLFELQPPLSRYPAGKNGELYSSIEERLAAVPGVDSVSASTSALLSNNISNDDFNPTGQTPVPGKEQTAYDNAVGDAFFSTYRIPILAGRAFNSSDTATSLKVAVVNQALVRQFFPGQNPIGKTFTTSGMKDEKLLYEIVGVCADAHYQDLRSAPPATFYMSYRQTPDISWGMSYEVKTKLARAAIAPSLREAVQSVDRNLPLIDVRTQQEQIDALSQQERIFATLSSAFGLLALTLACIGIYGIMSYTVARRTNEIGIRLVLGAQSRQVLAMVLREASWLSLAGVVVGIGGGLLLIRLIHTMLYGLRTYDPVSIAASAGLLVGISLLAGFLPARRASRVQPMEALRHE
jgi:predicted permease